MSMTIEEHRERAADFDPASVVAFAAAMAFYLYSLAPGTFWQDSAALQVQALTGTFWTLDARIYPMYVSLAGVVARAVDPGHVAVAINAMTAFFGAFAVFVLYRMLRFLGASRAASFATCFAFMSAHTVWYLAVITEVYTLYLALLFAALASVMRWNRDRPRELTLTAFLVSLGIFHHRLMLLTVPALVVYLWMRRRELNANAALAGAIGFACGFLPTVVSAFVLLGLGTAPGELAQSFFFSSPVWRGVILKLPYESLVRSAIYFLTFLPYNFAGIALPLGVLGIAHEWRNRTPETWLFATFLATSLAFGLNYTVEDQWVFFLPAYVAFTVFLARGVDVAVLRIEAAGHISRKTAGVLLAAIMMTIPPVTYEAVPVILGAADLAPWKRIAEHDYHRLLLNPNRRGDTTAEDYARRAFDHLPDGAVIYCEADSYFVMRFLRETRGFGQNVEVRFLDQVDAGFVADLVAGFDEPRPLYLLTFPYPRHREREAFEAAGTQLAPDLYLYRARTNTDASTD
ncbi:DUF2723 domain-containing protein [bacterium]|nr:DUF2723 domain-containing protein [bacterium]